MRSKSWETSQKQQSQTKREAHLQRSRNDRSRKLSHQQEKTKMLDNSNQKGKFQ
jgi:hypothetical protein